jgi:4-amino-4-deoxy-L-arabinose transferase-like glycosyltransferase
MSRRSREKAPVRAPAGRSTNTRTTGTREFNRQAQATRLRTARREITRRRWVSSRPPLRPMEVLRRLPRAALLCALVACMNAACWSIVTPPFQVTDEPTQFAYTQYVAEHGALPTAREGNYSPEETVAMAGLHQSAVLWHSENHTISSAAEQNSLQEELNQRPGRKGEGVGGSVADPPLSYLVQVVPYELASAGTLLDQLELMRLLNALVAGLTGLFVFLFIRETLPRVPWAWTVGGLSVALAPLLGFASGAVNPDAMLFAVSAAIFYCLARAFRRGLTRGVAIAIGALLLIGVLTKPNFVGLVPGVVLGLVVLTIRAARIHRGAAIRSLAIALAIPAGPVFVYALVNLLASRPGLGIASENLALGKGRSVFSALSLIWQLYLPPLPGMTNAFPGISTTLQLWFDRFVGLYGWLDTTFPPWVYTAALLPAGLIGLLGMRALAVNRIALRRRFSEIAVYVVMCVGLMALIGYHAYLNIGAEGAAGHAQPRYLLPLIPLAGVALALAARGAGRRLGPPVGAVIIVLFLAYDVFSQLLVVSRFYA